MNIEEIVLVGKKFLPYMTCSSSHNKVYICECQGIKLGNSQTENLLLEVIVEWFESNVREY